MPVSEPDAAPKALLVQCLGCGTSAQTDNCADPDSAVVCPPDSGCCQEDHSHAGLGCDRNVIIYANAVLTGEAGQ